MYRLSHSVMSDSVDPKDCGPPSSSIHRILQERILIGLPFSSHNQGIEPESLASPALAGRFFTTVTPGKPIECDNKNYI